MEVSQKGRSDLEKSFLLTVPCCVIKVIYGSYLRYFL